MLVGDLPTGAAANLALTGTDCDSRVVRPHHLFVCKGAAFRAAYLASARDAGVVAYLCDEDHAPALADAFPDLPALVVPGSSLRPAMALASALAWGRPDTDLTIVGTTGTKGKTTVSYMLASILDTGLSAPRTAMIGSVETFDGIDRFESINTTPEAPDLWRHLHNARSSGLTHVVMEVSSQGLKYDRVSGLTFDVGTFLNISRDHISPVEHPDFADYFGAKLRLFDITRTAVVNLATDHLGEVLARAQACERMVTFSAARDAAEKDPRPAGNANPRPAGSADARQTGGAVAHPDVWASDVTSGGGRVAFMAHTPDGTEKISLPMPGLFNVDNALAAIAMARELGISREQIAEGLARCQAPGRMEMVTAEGGRLVGIMDFAHNKLAFQRFFPSIREEFPDHAIVAVFGAPGGKAQERRRELAEVAGAWADHIVLTEDDPDREDPADICAQLASNLPDKASYEVVLDRTEATVRAIDWSLEHGRPAVICLLAKGNISWMHRDGRFEEDITDRERFLRALEVRGLAG